MSRKFKVDSKPKSSKGLKETRIRKKPSYSVDRATRNIKADPAELEIEWYSNQSKKSDWLKDEFTNFVEDFITDYQVENAINLLNNDLNSLKESGQDTVSITNSPKGKRLKQIIEMYFDVENPQQEYWFVKTDIKTEFQSSIDRAGSVRVVMVNAKDMESNKHFLQILFVDPYHLFIPGRHNGKTAEEMKRETYKNYSELDTCLSKHLK